MVKNEEQVARHRQVNFAGVAPSRAAGASRPLGPSQAQLPAFSAISYFFVAVDLLTHYTAMREAASRQLALGRAEPDLLLDDPADTRRGLTLLARLPAPGVAALGPVLAAFRQLEPAQYYYPASSLHLTVLSLISCHPGFTLAAIAPVAYQQAVREALQATGPFTLTFRGLTASPGAILLQGFPHDDSLATLREALRQAFQASGLRQTIDQRYRLQTAHVTAVRFRVPLAQPAGVVALLAQYAQHFFATVQLTELELVFNDWYQRTEHTQVLEKFQL